MDTNKIKKIPNTLISFLFYFIKKFKMGIFMLVLTAFGYSFCQTSFPYFIKLIINAIYIRSPSRGLVFNEIKYLIFFLCGMWIIMQAIINIQGFFIYKVMPSFKTKIKESLFDLVAQYRMDYFSKFSSGMINQRICELASSAERILQLSIFNFLSIIAAFTMSIIIMYFVSPLFSLIMLIWYVAHFYVSFYFIKKGVSIESNYVDSTRKASMFVDDIFFNILNVRLFNRFDLERKRLLNLQSDEIKSCRRAIRHYEKMKLIQSILVITAIISIMLLLLYYWRKGIATVGDFAMIAMLSFSSITFVWQVSSQLVIFSRELGSIKSNLSVINYNEVDLSIYSDGEVNDIPINRIQFKNVTFCYDNKYPIIKNFSFDINRGDKIGIIGQSGLGKTTLINLLLGVYQNYQGSLLVNNIEISNLLKGSMYKKIGFVSQNIALLHRSIKDNIKYGNHAATDLDIINAARLAQCSDFIESLPKGYDTIIGVNGVKLSGGQRQRIALARMIIKNAPVIIMDEPSSALDSYTEQKICENLYNFLKSKTIVIISHNSAFLQLVDNVYQLINNRLELLESYKNQWTTSVESNF